MEMKRPKSAPVHHFSTLSDIHFNFIAQNRFNYLIFSTFNIYFKQINPSMTKVMHDA